MIDGGAQLLQIGRILAKSLILHGIAQIGEAVGGFVFFQIKKILIIGVR
jgi:hypothetical protein